MQVPPPPHRRPFEATRGGGARFLVAPKETVPATKGAEF